MPTVAEQLHHAREELKLDIYQVAEITKIKTDHIRALESGDYDAFTAPVYIRGFVRTYARALRMDEARVLGDLDAELAQTKNFRDPPPLSGQNEGVLDYVMLQLSRLNWRVVVLILALLLIGLLAFTWLRSGRQTAADPIQDLGPGLYQPAQPPGETLPLQTNALPL